MQLLYVRINLKNFTNEAIDIGAKKIVFF